MSNLFLILAWFLMQILDESLIHHLSFVRSSPVKSCLVNWTLPSTVQCVIKNSYVQMQKMPICLARFQSVIMP
ncbi:hypothetical protein B0T24DRAFT_208744 [Lasiosphaeria ovina]|uniref:Secreted protein n=1 Tax=Lasiosphaeria ovina TaxID=92902 RepID=A0AAE0KHH4_9PEZI|nr:hypothetical protein B0T24DRAFT_208744 [Lasiosphaeria ovina]